MSYTPILKHTNTLGMYKVLGTSTTYL